jgi:putative CocE/NonD family hydrolase
LLSALSLPYEDFVRAGYIIVFQDIRGKYGSEGIYEMARPIRGPLNQSATDESTDIYDTIDWLVHHVRESNGRVGMIGSSYGGFEVVMGLLNPHPALKAAVSESPMIDGWIGDDWFHYGAFRQVNLDYFASQTGQKGSGKNVSRAAYDDYETFLKAGSTGDYAKANGFEQLPWWRKISQHPSYDGFWQAQALDKILVARASNIPTLWEQGFWDQEDIWGAIHSWLALKNAGHMESNWLVMGPWSHSQVSLPGWDLGPFRWTGDTTYQFRHDMVLPFFNQYLKDGPPARLARATIYNPAENRWQMFDDWPGGCESGCKRGLTPVFLRSGFSLSFDAPSDAGGSDSYVSDPAKPVPYVPRPLQLSDAQQWRTWLVHDQRFVDGRPDVLMYETEPLTEAVKIEGAPVADVIASITGSDIDIVVRLIDVYPPEYPSQPGLGGYELPIASDIFRGRYRESFEHPSPIPANTPQHFKFQLPTQNYTFLPGHRIMVQIQSTLFPLYDRNPQTYVANVFFAKPTDYQKSTVTILRSGSYASAVWLPIVP